MSADIKPTDAERPALSAEDIERLARETVAALMAKGCHGAIVVVAQERNGGATIDWRLWHDAPRIAVMVTLATVTADYLRGLTHRLLGRIQPPPPAPATTGPVAGNGGIGGGVAGGSGAGSAN